MFECNYVCEIRSEKSVKLQSDHPNIIQAQCLHAMANKVYQLRTGLPKTRNCWRYHNSTQILAHKWSKT